MDKEENEGKALWLVTVKGRESRKEVENDGMNVIENHPLIARILSLKWSWFYLHYYILYFLISDFQHMTVQKAQ